jgi:hypothetical protein
VCSVLANGYRADLRRAGLGSGCHAFTAKLPADVVGRVEVRRAADKAALACTDTAEFAVAEVAMLRPKRAAVSGRKVMKTGSAQRVIPASSEPDLVEVGVAGQGLQLGCGQLLPRGAEGIDDGVVAVE